MGRLRIGNPVGELADLPVANPAAQAPERAANLRQRHAEHGFARIAQLGTVRHKAHALEVDIGAGGDRDQRLVADAFALRILLGRRHGQGAGGFEHAAGVFEHILDRGAQRIGIHGDDLVQVAAA
ncbi:hypothetical protein D3C72_2017160 [compost metagenome]